MENGFQYVGKRVEIPVHYDLWARGARTGTVVDARWSLKNGRYLRVIMDHPSVRKPVNVSEIDWPFLKVLS